MSAGGKNIGDLKMHAIFFRVTIETSPASVQRAVISLPVRRQLLRSLRIHHFSPPPSVRSSLLRFCRCFRSAAAVSKTRFCWNVHKTERFHFFGRPSLLASLCSLLKLRDASVSVENWTSLLLDSAESPDPQRRFLRTTDGRLSLESGGTELGVSGRFGVSDEEMAEAVIAVLRQLPSEYQGLVFIELLRVRTIREIPRFSIRNLCFATRSRIQQCWAPSKRSTPELRWLDKTRTSAWMYICYYTDLVCSWHVIRHIDTTLGVIGLRIRAYRNIGYLS